MSSTPKLVGILNITPDSFFDGGRHQDAADILQSAQTLLDQGAALIDVGAEATNPFVEPISSAEEVKRLSVVLPELLQQFPNKISLDTYHPETLAWALQFGKPILNDVSGLHNTELAMLAIKHDLTCIVGHLPPEANGIPIKSHASSIADIKMVVRQLLRTAEALQAEGLPRENIILDPNIGFGKTMPLNWQLLEFARYVPNYEVMIGHSNKRFLGCDPKTGSMLKQGSELRYTSERNLAAAQIATAAGTQYLRVHNPSDYQTLLDGFKK